VSTGGRRVGHDHHSRVERKGIVRDGPRSGPSVPTAKLSPLLLRLNDLQGRSGGKDVTRKALATRWPKLRRSLAPSTCIRNGAPIDLRALVPLIADARLRGAVLDELAVITGETFGHDPRLGERGWVDYSARVAGWVADHAADYAVGARHKGGWPVDLVALDRSSAAWL
jgi:hypothetical protein